MKFAMTVLIIGLLAVTVLAQEQKQEAGNLLQDVIVEESYEADFEEEKLPLRIAFDFSDVLEIKERANWNSTDDGRETTTSWLPEMRLGRPELADISPAPVKVFQTELENIARWELKIIATDGSLFRKLNGEGNPPKQIAWDGLGDDGDFLIPGHSYSFSLTAVDQAGNKGTFPGHSFSVPAFYLHRDGTVIIGLAVTKIVSADGLRLHPAAESTAREVADLIRNYLSEDRVTVTGQNSQIDEFIQLMAAELIVDTSFFKRVPQQNQNGDHVILEIK